MVQRRSWLLAVLAGVVLAWYGLLLGLPHTHTDPKVPRYEAPCTAAHPGSHAYHLHGSAHLLAPHLCLACLASSTVADSEAGQPFLEPAPVSRAPLVAAPNCGHEIHAYLPDLRAPPAGC